MKITLNTRFPESLWLVRILLFGMMISLAGTARPALASCGGVTNVNSQAQLNASISDFNSQGSPCHYTIALATDIDLTASTTTINNPVENVDLVLNGNGYYVSGQLIGGVRPFQIANDTTVTMQNITIQRGNVATNGGGIHNSGNLTLSNASITFNAAGQEGAVCGTVL